jgi:rsbT co-antagonist protein RsbR
MKEQEKNSLAAIIRAHEPELLGRLGEGAGGDSTRRDQVHEAESRKLAKEFLGDRRPAIASGSRDVRSECWSKVRELLTELSAARATQGYSPSETAMFVFSLKKPLFARLRRELGSDAEAQADRMWEATLLLDALGLFTTEMYQKSREQVIQRQQRELLELSTPVVELWEGVLALPLIGTLDSNRTQVVMESLLEKIVESGAALAIIDITGVPPWTRSSPSTR